MKKIKIAVVGYGNRGQVYADYSLDEPQEVEVVAVVDCNKYKLEVAKERYGLTNQQVFSTYKEFLASGLEVDVVINATMDQDHYKTAMEILESNHDMLIEKPIVAKREELVDIHNLAKEKGRKVFVCHVLRYSPFYKRIKEIISTGKLGGIISMEMNEHVWIPHYLTSYVRGKWNKESECGSPVLLAKCCHDTDLMCWLNNITTPESVSSFGSKSFFTEANAPEGATQYCYQCPNQKSCMFNAEKFQIEKDFIPFYTWAGINKPLDEITIEEKREFLKKDVYGQCVFKTDMDIVDRQCVAVQFANGSIGTLNMVGGASVADRHIHIICEYGEIVGYIGSDKIIVRVFNKDKIAAEEECIDLNEKKNFDSEDNSVAGHYGGDYYIMKDLVKFLNGEKTSVSTTVIEDSVNSHLICYAAEKARREKVVVNLNEEYV